MCIRDRAWRDRNRGRRDARKPVRADLIRRIVDFLHELQNACCIVAKIVPAKAGDGADVDPRFVAHPAEADGDVVANAHQPRFVDRLDPAEAASVIGAHFLDDAPFERLDRLRDKLERLFRLVLQDKRPDRRVGALLRRAATAIDFRRNAPLARGYDTSCLLYTSRCV